MKTLQVKQEEVRDFWPLVYPYLQKSIRLFGNSIYYSQEDFIQLCEEGLMQLWIGVTDDVLQGALISQLCTYPQCKVAKLLYCGSDSGLKAWNEVMPTLRDWAKANGCSYIEAFGRRGWGRVFNNFEDCGVLLRSAL